MDATTAKTPVLVARRLTGNRSHVCEVVFPGPGTPSKEILSDGAFAAKYGFELAEGCERKLEISCRLVGGPVRSEGPYDDPVGPKMPGTGVARPSRAEPDWSRLAKLAGKHTTPEIASILGSTVWVVRKRLKDGGIGVMRANTTTAEVKERMAVVKRLAGTKTRTQIAKRLGVSVWVVDRDLRALGTRAVHGSCRGKDMRLPGSPARRPGETGGSPPSWGRPKKDVSRVAELARTKTEREMAETIGVSIPTVRKELRRLGLKAVPGGRHYWKGGTPGGAP